HGGGSVSNGGNITFVAFSQTSLETGLRSGRIPKPDPKILASRAVVPAGLLTARIGWRASAGGVGRCDSCQQLGPERDRSGGKSNKFAHSVLLLKWVKRGDKIFNLRAPCESCNLEKQ